MKYKHLTQQQRYAISVMLQRPMTMTAIAEIIGVSKSTVSREVKRNCDERGANENTNGLARQYIPKGSDFDLYSEEHITEIEWKLNHRPRKSLGYLTPLEYFKKLYNFDFGSRCASI